MWDGSLVLRDAGGVCLAIYSDFPQSVGKYFCLCVCGVNAIINVALFVCGSGLVSQR